MSITRINESTLLALGMDRPTVKALAHLLRMVGGSENALTLPQIVLAVATVQESLALLEANPVPELAQAIPDDVTPPQVPHVTASNDLTPVAQLCTAVEFLHTEVRQIAEQQVVLMSLINELRQGTML